MHEARQLKPAAVAVMICAVMVLAAGALSVSAYTHLVVRGAQGPRANAVSWTYTPTDHGKWTGHVVNSGLRSIVVDVVDVASGSSLLHQRIRFAEYGGNTLNTEEVALIKNRTYNITVIPIGPRGSSCTVEDIYVIPPMPPGALFTLTISGPTVDVDGSSSYDPHGTIVMWAWEWGDETVSGPNAVPTASHTYAMTGNYTIVLTVLSSTGLTDCETHEVRVDVVEKPAASFTATVGPDGYTVTANASASTGVDLTYAWDWGDSWTSVGMTRTHAYVSQQSGSNYTVTLTVTDRYGQTSSSSQKVFVTNWHMWEPISVVGLTLAGDGVTQLPGCAVTFTVVRNGDTMIGIMSDADGFYSGILYPFDVLDGDTLLVRAVGPAGQTGSATGVVDWMVWYLIIDVTLS